MPFTHSDPRFTMWSKSPSMEINLPSRTEATMPQPQEQKLQEVVNSLTSESFNFCVLARTAATSTRPPKASPAQRLAPVLNHCLRVTPVGVFDDSQMVSLFSFTFPSLLRPLVSRRLNLHSTCEPLLEVT